MTGPVEAALVDGIRERGCIHLALIDPEKFSNNLPQIVTDLEDHGTTAIMIGGSTLNSSSTRYLIESQVIGASVVRRFNLEPIPLGYMIVGQSETAVSTVGRAKPVPFSKVDLATDYALAAQYLGMRFVYLEAGSGAEHMVDPRMVSKVSEKINVPLIVGGGIRTPSQAERLARAGASAIVTGTVIEQEGPGRVKQILQALKRP